MRCIYNLNKSETGSWQSTPYTILLHTSQFGILARVFPDPACEESLKPSVFLMGNIPTLILLTHLNWRSISHFHSTSFKSRYEFSPIKSSSWVATRLITRGEQFNPYVYTHLNAFTHLQPPSLSNKNSFLLLLFYYSTSLLAWLRGESEPVCISHSQHSSSYAFECTYSSPHPSPPSKIDK